MNLTGEKSPFDGIEKKIREDREMKEQPYNENFNDTFSKSENKASVGTQFGLTVIRPFMMLFTGWIVQMFI